MDETLFDTLPELETDTTHLHKWNYFRGSIKTLWEAERFSWRRLVDWGTLGDVIFRVPFVQEFFDWK